MCYIVYNLGLSGAAICGLSGLSYLGLMCEMSWLFSVLNFTMSTICCWVLFDSEYSPLLVGYHWLGSLGFGFLLVCGTLQQCFCVVFNGFG